MLPILIALLALAVLWWCAEILSDLYILTAIVIVAIHLL